MASVSIRKETNTLYLDFRYMGKRCREQTTLKATVANRKRLERTLVKIESEIIAGTFRYKNHFPDSKVGDQFADLEMQLHEPDEWEINQSKKTVPTFEEFVVLWIERNKISWRRSHIVNIESIVSKHYLPFFGKMKVDDITRNDILKFRTSLAKVPGRNGKESLANTRINKIVNPLKRIFEDAADEYKFTTPYVRIKPLKSPKTDAFPFTIEEVNLILDTVRPDYRDYFLVRFFTGMRTGEIDGLKWKYVDFENRVIKIRETVVSGEEDITKTESSVRDIHMSTPVYNALLRQKKHSEHFGKFVFCNRNGDAINHNNVTQRIWYPLLKRLGLEKRRPYQTRHTAATLWLASGESPEWIAQQMGHANTSMLFRVYSRYVPNLTRMDGSAIEQLLQSKLGVKYA
ncbi:site-specific integrase [Maribrevibacterium harenarium]|uniref:Site-specific integrase n=1 Tax=Maribrevibacterium harenarium TaxID=2589817 RepID=A0A501WB20_9GAMM|nr:site-specific integrase [Maribrevibacterium harenarium]TPE46598.1 site-specific integrase [Maribrevibacterium harenarium]